MDEHGYFQLHEKEENHWEVKAGCLMRHHVRPRRQRFGVQHFPDDAPLPADRLDSVRVTVVNETNGKTTIHTDNGMDDSEPVPRSWTGVTIFQINAPTRKEFAMYSRGSFNGARHATKRVQAQPSSEVQEGKQR